MILNQDGDTEFVINRQNSKIAFLQSENNQLQDDNQDLQNAIKMNLDALRIAYDQNVSNKQSGQSTVINDNQQYSTSAAQEILERQIAENKYLLKTYQRCSKERTSLATQNLLLSQVNDETAKFYKDVIHDLEEKVLELRRIIQDKEYTIQTLEKKITLPDKDGVLLKIKEIVTPNEQTIPLHSEIEKHKVQCDVLTQQIKNLFAENSEIKQANISLKHEIVKITSCLQSNVGYQNLKHLLKGQLVQEDSFTFPQKNLIQQIFNFQQQQQSNIQAIQKKTPNATMFSSLLLQDIEGYFLTNYTKTPRHLLPGSQQNWKSNMKSPREPQSRVDLIQKIEHLEDQLEKIKKLYYKSTKNAKTQFYEILEKRKEISRMNLQITTLQKSNRQYENKFKNQQGESDFYKDFFQNYMLDMQKKRRNSLELKVKENYYYKKQEEEEEEDEDTQKQKKDLILEQGLENFLSDLQENKKENLDYLVKDDILHESMDKQQYNYLWQKLNKHIISITPLIEQQIKIPKIESLQQEKPINRARSISDPTVYFNITINEKRKLIKGWKKPKNQNKLNQFGVQKGNRNNFNIIDQKQSPFFMDLSAIGPDIAQQQKKYNANKKQNKPQQQKQDQNNNQVQVGGDQSFGGNYNQNQQNQKNYQNQQQQQAQDYSDDDDVDIEL